MMLLKNIFDYTIAFFGLLFLWPLLLVVAVLIKVKMPGGTIIFKQKRVGRYGELFVMYKFRTMSSGSSISMARESRITSLGVVLRKYKIDELPQLFNVLAGDMSLVGPRPDVPGYADKLEGIERGILDIKPGITGPASLKYRDEEELLAKQLDPQKYNDEVIFPDKVRINLNYVQHWSLCLDIKIIIYTVLRKNLNQDWYK